MLKRNVIPPASGHAKQMIVLVHGYGGHMKSMEWLAQRWQADFPDAVFVLPEAPDPCPQASGTFQWFSARSTDANPQAQRDFQIAQVSPRLNACIDEEMKNWNIPDGKVAMAGFSQGAMMALHAGPRRSKTIAALAGFSGRLLDAAGLQKPGITKPPVALIHGENDQVVPFTLMAEAAVELRKAGFRVSEIARPTLGHVMDKTGIEAARRLFADSLGLSPPQPPAAGKTASKFIPKR